MSKIVTPMDLAMAGLKVWQFHAQNAVNASLRVESIAESAMAANTARSDREKPTGAP